MALFVFKGVTIFKPEDICGDYVAGDGGCEYITGEMFCRKPDVFKCSLYEYLFMGKISVSQCNTWMFCHRAWKHRYIDGIEMIDKMKGRPLKIGSLIHQGVEQIYNGKPVELDYGRYFGDEDTKEIGIVKVMLDKLVTLPKPDEPCIPEAEFNVDIPDCPKINGVIDVLYAEHFDEFKCSGNVDYYLTPHFLQSQLATYFLSDTKLRYCDMKIIRIPQLKSTGQYKEENAERYVERVREDVNHRPAYYFTGLDDKGWGKRFFRSEFDMDEVVERYIHVKHEMRLAIKRKVFYKSERNCLYPYPCDYLQICECGGVSDILYRYKEKPIDMDEVPF